MINTPVLRQKYKFAWIAGVYTCAGMNEIDTARFKHDQACAQRKHSFDLVHWGQKLSWQLIPPGNHRWLGGNFGGFHLSRSWWGVWVCLGWLVQAPFLFWVFPFGHVWINDIYGYRRKLSQQYIEDIQHALWIMVGSCGQQGRRRGSFGDLSGWSWTASTAAPPRHPGHSGVEVE